MRSALQAPTGYDNEIHYDGVVMEGYESVHDVKIESPRQTFTCPLEDTNEYTIEKAKALIYSCASEMGFASNHTPFKVERYNDVDTETIKFRLETTFTM